MHIFLQIFVREKTLKVLPTKLLVGNDGESGNNGREWGVNKVRGNIQKTFSVVL